MTAPTRRQLIAGSLATVGAASAPAIAVAADPDERIQNAVQELREAVQERWPGLQVTCLEHLSDPHASNYNNPGIMLVASEPRP